MRGLIFTGEIDGDQWRVVLHAERCGEPYRYAAAMERSIFLTNEACVLCLHKAIVDIVEMSNFFEYREAKITPLTGAMREAIW